MDYLITIVILLPAVWFAAMRSSWLVDYAFLVLAFNRGLRRIVDYYVNHEFKALSPISLTPLIVILLLMIPFLSRFSLLMPRVKLIFGLFFAACACGFTIGFVQNSFAAVFQLAEYLAPLSLMGFAATANASPKTTDRWIQSVGWTGVGVAAYGWFQYFHPPLWDALWMEQTGMIGYLGIPEPTQIVVFSTMAERGPFASYLAASAIPMIVARRWRIWGGWLAVAFILSVIPLSYVRTALIGVALVVLIKPIVNRGRGFVAILLSAALVFMAVKYGVDQLPTSEQVMARYESLGSLREDSSFQGRLEIASAGIDLVASHPLGFGFGATGMSGRVNTGGVASGSKFMDNGYITLMLDYGWLGGLLFFSAVGLIWLEMRSRFNKGVQDEYMALGRAWYLALLITLYVANVYTGAYVFWLFAGVVLSSRYDPMIRRLLAEKLKQRAETRTVSASDAAPASAAPFFQQNMPPG